MFKLFQHWILVAFSVDCSIPSTYPHHFHFSVFTSGNYKLPQAHILCSLFQVHNWPFSWFLLLKNKIINKDLGPGYAHCYWDVIISRPSLWTELRSICNITIHLYLYEIKHEFTLVSPVYVSHLLLLQTLLQLMTLHTCQVTCMQVDMQDKFPNP